MFTAFDATDFQRLETFFDELPGPVDHLLVRGPAPYFALLAEFDIEEARRDLEAKIVSALQVARNAARKVRSGGTLLFVGGPRGRRRWHACGAADRAGAHRSVSL
jgi:hypothetical protein